MIIKEWPQGTLSVQKLDDYLTVLSERKKFLPQLILIDYADIMKRPQGMDRWEGLIDISEGLRGLAQSRKVAVATVSQTKISGATARQVDMEHVGGAWDKIATADTVITYTQSEEEQVHSLARLFVAKARTEEGRFGVLISQAYSIGQFVMNSTRIGSNYGSEDSSER